MQISAPGKAILVGEHGVVYGYPAIAVPVKELCAAAEVREGIPGQGIRTRALDLGLDCTPGEENPPEGCLALDRAIEGTLDYLRLGRKHDLEITVHSTIPIARGLGSGAAISVALIRAIAGHFQKELSPQEVSGLAYETEKLHHGTPSGIDNTVIAYGEPLYFRRGEPPQFLRLGAPITLAIADTGIPSSTKVAIGRVREGRERDGEHYRALFDTIGHAVERARETLERGNLEALGRLMDQNQALLQALGVSSPELDSLVEKAKQAGAWGAKLSGAGCGGIIIALIAEEKAPSIARALREAGAASVTIAQVG